MWAELKPGRSTRKITALPNIPVERTARAWALWVGLGVIPVGRRSPGALKFFVGPSLFAIQPERPQYRLIMHREQNRFVAG